MEELYIAQVDYREARKFADINAILLDLNSVMETCKRLMQLLKENSEDYILIESLWTAALIRYTRCFAVSKRTFCLSEDIYTSLPGDAVEVHQFYKNLRDKHIAHSVNPYEQIEVGLVLSPEGSAGRKVMGITTLSVKHICTTADGVWQLGALAKVLLNKLTDIGKEYGEKALAIGKSLPIDELYSRAHPGITAPSSMASGKPRTQKQHEDD